MKTASSSFLPSLAPLAPLALALLVSRSAGAQEVSRAQALFDEGRHLMSEGRFAEACPKLAASQKLDPGAGTLMNLAACYEKNGQLASAWATLREASSAARVSNHPDWELAARTRADQLEPGLPRLSVIVPREARVEGLVIDRDGRELDPAEWDAAIPIDAGVHAIHARAPGRVAWSMEVTIAEAAARTEVKVPQLASEPQAAEPVAPASPVTPRDEPRSGAPPASSGSSQRTLGIVVAGAGAVGLATGAVFGLLAKSTQDESLGYCNAARQCEPRGLELDRAAGTQADISTVAFVAGGALLLGGAVLYLTASRSPQSASAPLRLSVGASGPMGMNLRGSF